jgi:hypothetical protein
MPDDPPASTPTPRPGVLPWLVGLFALWQLVFIPLANAWHFVPQRPDPNDLNPDMDTNQTRGSFTTAEPLQQSAEAVGDVLAFWAEVSGERQGWSMFTPGFPPHTLVPVVELRFPDGSTDRIRSRFEPIDPDRAGVRPPLLFDRPFNFEVQLTVAAWYADETSLRDRPDYWSALPERIRPHERRVRQWLAWHVKNYRAAHPDTPDPVEVTLITRFISTPLPSERGERKPTWERPFVRWRSNGSLEGFDPVNRRWVALTEGSP